MTTIHHLAAMPVARRLLITLTLIFAFALSIEAQSQRTFVSTSGSDANTASLCSTANPCRSFAAAQTVTTAGGEIIALTSGGYGPVEIIKSLQITAPTGVYVAITALPSTAIGGTDAIRISAGTGGRIVLRGLTLNNVGVTNANGITFPSGESLFVENCVINGFDRQGISGERSTVGNSELFVTDTVIRNGDLTNSNDNAGIFLRSTGAGIIRTTIDNCRLERAGFVGLWSLDNTRTTVRNTVASHNRFGFIASNSAGTAAELNLENCTVTHSQTDGIFVGGTATARLSNTVSANNGGDGISISLNGTAHISDSTLNGNVSDGIELFNSATARVYVATTTISGNVGKGLNRNGATNIAVSTGSNNILNNTGGSDPFSSTIGQQ